MVRAIIPDISSFIRFHELDPRTQDQCIYITQKGSRCLWPSSNNGRAKELYAMLSQCQDNSIDVKVLRDYIVSNCCKSGRAQHRDRIADVNLLPSLVQRWRAEIMAEIQGRLRSDSVVSDTFNFIASNPLSEFRPHVAEPTADDSVAFKVQNQLEDRDFERGSLYVFNRISSPGHVKIGWTARSVQGRLDDWSRCGYFPNLLFSETSIPFAQRAETLVHYELICEWRRERMCKADWCRKSHCEWFEVSVERAIRVVGDWAKLFKASPLYDAQGLLKPYWRSVVKDVIKGGEMVTAHMLLQRLPQIQQDKHMALPHAAASGIPIKRELGERIQAILKMNETRGENHLPVGSIPIKQELSFTTSSHLSQSLPEPVSPLKKLLVTSMKRSKSFPALRREAVSEDDVRPVSRRLPSIKKETTLVQSVFKPGPIIKAEEDD
jgi:hypothetical protein